jgi:hypothetical protein
MGIARIVGGGLAGLGIVGAGYLGTAGQDESVRDESGQVIQGGEVGAFRIRLGDCVNIGDVTMVESVQAVPCGQLHEAEVYYAFNLPDSAWPGDVAVEDQADAGCLAHFDDFVGLPYEASRYDYTTLMPSEQTWDEFDDREVLCFLVNYDGTLKRGSGRGAAI